MTFAAWTLLISLIQSPVDLKADERLLVSTSVEAGPKTIKSILSDIQTQTGVELKPAKEIEEDLCILHVRERPAHEILFVIAEHFGWQWEKNDQGYILRQKNETRAKEEKELREELLKLSHLIKKRAEESLRERESSDFQALLKEYQDIQNKIKELSARPNTDEEIAQLESLKDRASTLYHSLDPVSYLGDLLTSELTESQYLELVRRGKLVFSSNPTRAQLPLPPRSARFVPQFLNRLTQFKTLIEEEETNIPLKEIKALRVILTMPDLPFTGILPFEQLFFTSEGFGCKVEVLGSGVILFSKLTSQFRALGIEEKEPTPVSQEKLQTLPPKFLEPWTPTDQIKRLLVSLSGSDEELTFEFIMSLFLGSEDIDLLELSSKMLTELGNTTETPLISDAYDFHILSLPEPSSASTETPALFLQALAKARSAEWDYSKGWLRIRTTPHALGRATTVPRAVLEQLTDAKKKQGGLRLDDLAHAVSQMTDFQAHAFLNVHLGRFFPLLSVFGAEKRILIEFLRTWASLSHPVQEILANGGILRVRELPLPARASLERLLFLFTQEEYTLLGHAGETPEVIPSVPEDPPPSKAEKTPFPTDQEFTQLFPLGPPPDASLYLNKTTLPGILTKFKFGNTVVELPSTIEEFAVLAEEFMEEGVSLLFAFSVKPAVLETHTFVVNLAPGLERRYTTSVATADPKVPFGKIEDLPEDIRKHISAAIQKMKSRKEPPPDASCSFSW